MANYKSLYDHEHEEAIAIYCAKNNVEFDEANAYDVVLETFKNNPIKYTHKDKETGEEKEYDKTQRVARQIEFQPKTIARIAAKAEVYKKRFAAEFYAKNIEKAKKDRAPSLDKLVDNLYLLNIVDGQSYLAFVNNLMQIVYSRDNEIPEDDKTCMIFNGVPRNGKSATAKAICEVETQFGNVYRAGSPKILSAQHAERVYQSHLNSFDEIKSSDIVREDVLSLINGGERELDPKNKKQYIQRVNTNLIFTSNDQLNLIQRRISLIKFGNRLNGRPLGEGTLKNIITEIMNSLPDFSHYYDIYNIVSKYNENRVNPQAVDDVISFMYSKFGFVKETDDVTLTAEIIFSPHDVYEHIRGQNIKQMVISERKDSIRTFLRLLAERGIVDEIKYPKCTTTSYKVNGANFLKIVTEFQKINTKDEVNTKITKQELRDLLAPYFEPTLPEDYVPLTKIKLPEVIITPPPAKLLALPSPEYFNKNSGEADIKNGNAANMKSDETAEIKNSATSTIKELSIDLETYSDVDIKQNGVYKYADNPNFDILLFAYSVNGGDVKVVDLASGEKIPEDVLKALTDDTVIKWAFNANFERVCLSVWLQKYYPQYFKGYQSDEKALQNYLSPTSWRCSMVWSNYVGLPHSLDAVGKELNLTDQKMKEGKELIKYFCCPCKPIVKNGMRTRNLPQHNPDGWETFKQYNKRDVEAELEIKERLRLTPVPEDVWKQYVIDQKINDRGVKIDTAFVQKAQEVDDTIRDINYAELKNITGLDNPNSTVQLKNWLKTQGVTTENLDKKAIEELLTQHNEGIVPQALKLKLQLAKSSVKKYSRMQDMTTQDGRARGCFMFYGATTTGRWAGRGIQLQNLPQNHLKELDAARNAILNADYEAMREKFISEDGKTSYNTPDALSQLLRTAIIPDDGHKFIVADYSQIEARVLSVIAGEEWRLKAFANNKDIYCESASHMFNKPVEKNGINGDLRDKGKIAELALGYGGGENALIRMGALDMGISAEELPSLVTQWRASNPQIVEFWKKCDKAAKEAIRKRSYAEVDNIRFWCPENILYIELPSGRSLAYRNPELQKDENGYDKIVYRGGKDKKLQEVSTYGAKLVENIIQGISRDILAYALGNLADYKVVAHVHDEVIVEVPMNIKDETICNIMSQTPSWIEGLLLKAKGYECPYYQKQ